MTAALFRKSLTSLFSKNSSVLCKSHVSFSLYFSTDRENQLVDTPTISEFLMNKHHFSVEGASRVASVLTRLKNLDKADLMLSFLKETGFSNTQLEKTVKSMPKVLSANLETIIKPRIQIIQDFGFTANEIADILSKNPFLLRNSVNNLISSISMLKGFLRSNVEVAKFLRTSSLFLRDLEKTLIANVEFLRSCGVPMERIIRLMKVTQFLFFHKPETVRKYVEKADEMGFDRSDRRFIYALLAISSMTNETWELKLKTLRELGFSEDDILRVFRNSPLVFCVSEKKMKQVTEVLLETGKYDMSCIVNFATVFQYSVEKRHKPRLQVLSILEKKNLIQTWPSLGTLHLMPNAKFFEKFVAPYLDEVGNVWSAATGKGEVKLEGL